MDTLRRKILEHGMKARLLSLIPDPFAITAEQAADLARSFTEETGIEGSEFGRPAFYLNGGPLYGVPLILVHDEKVA